MSALAIWFHYDREALHPLGNLPVECGECPSKCKSTNEIAKCPLDSSPRRRGLTKIKGGELYVCTNEATGSSRLFKEKMKAVRAFLPVMEDYTERATQEISTSVHRLVHNLLTLNAQTLQAIYNAVPQEEFSEKRREQLLSSLQDRILQDPPRIARALVNVLKIATQEKTEFTVYGKLYDDEPLRPRACPIHKLVLLVHNTFWSTFQEKDVRIRLGECWQTVHVDYDTMVAALVELFRNAAKYVLPGSFLDISFEETDNSISIVFDMVSLKVAPDEVEKIYVEGYSGEETKKIGRQGEGRGMGVVRRLLEMNDGSVRFLSDVDQGKRQDRMGVHFEGNVLRVSLPRN